MSATMIQQPAPNFKAEAVLANGEFGGTLSDYKDNKYVVLFSILWILPLYAHQS